MLHNRSILVKDRIYPVGALSQRIRIVEHRGVAGIQLTLIHHNSVFCRIEDSGFTPGILKTIREVVGDLGFALGSLLSGNEHNTVGGACTIHGTGSGILQNLDTLDIVGIQVVDATGSHAIHNVKRFGVVNCADTTDANLRSGIRSTRTLNDSNTRSHTLQDIVHAGLSSGLQVIGGNAGNGGCHNRFLLDTVTDDNCLLQHLAVILQDNIQRLGIGNCVLFAFITQAGYLYNRAARNVNGKRPIRVRHGTIAGSKLNDESTHNGLVVSVQDSSTKGDALRHCNQAQS